MKKIIALILAVAMTFSVAGAYWFDDIVDSKNQEAIELLYELGIIEGYGYRQFGPKDNLTRAQACALLVRALVPEQEIYKSYDENFKDVHYSEWYRVYVDTAYRNGFVNGYGNGEFGPHDKVTYAQFATILTNILGYSATKLAGTWPTNVLSLADNLHLFTNTSTAIATHADAITREDAAQMIYNAMTCDMADGSNTRFMDKIITNYTYTIEGTVIYVAQTGGSITNRYIANFWIVDTAGQVHEIYGPSANVISAGEYVIITYSFAGDVIDMQNYAMEDTYDIYVDGTIFDFNANNVYHTNPDCELLEGCRVMYIKSNELPENWTLCLTCGKR